MNLRATSLAAGGALLVGILLAQPATGQEDEDRRTVRVFEMSRGSYLGVYIADVDADDVERLGLPEERGVLITGVADEGPARDAGLQEDDVIFEWNGDRIESEAQLRRVLKETPPGRTARVAVFRSGSRTSVDVELGESGPAALSLRSGWRQPDAEALRERMRDMEVRVREMPQIRTLYSYSMRGGRLGVGIQSLEPQLAEFFGLGDRDGVLITTVREDSPAEKGGLKAGDVILAVDGEEIESARDVSRMVRDADPGPVALRILRDRDERTITVDLPETPESGPWEEEGVHGFMFRPDDLHLDDVNVEWAEPLRLHLEGITPLLLDLVGPTPEGRGEPIQVPSSPGVSSI